VSTHDDPTPMQVPVFAVIRFDPDQESPDDQVAVWEVLTDRGEAEIEVGHLNAQVPYGSPTRFILSETTLYPEGRHSARGAWEAPAKPPGTPAGPPAPAERMEGEWGFMVEALDDRQG